MKRAYFQHLVQAKKFLNMVKLNTKTVRWHYLEPIDGGYLVEWYVK